MAKQQWFLTALYFSLFLKNKTNSFKDLKDLYSMASTCLDFNPAFSKTQQKKSICLNFSNINNTNKHLPTLYELFEVEEKQVKDCMIKWTKNFEHNILMGQWENMWKMY